MVDFRLRCGEVMPRFLLVTLLFAAGCASPGPEEAAPRYSISTETTEQGVELLVLKDAQAGVEAAATPSVGGELGSLRVRVGEEWIETLYRGRDYSPIEGFGGRGPLLWPATGRSFPPDLIERLEGGERFNDGAWIHEGKRYPMPIHGFVKDREWTVESQEATERFARLVLALGDDEETRESYPFGFRLTATYTLVQGTLDIRYDVTAGEDNAGPMPFSIGNHITFKTPLLAGSDPAEMTLLAPSRTELLKTGYGVPTGETRRRSHQTPAKLGEWEKLSAVSLTGFAGNHPMILLKDPGGLQILMSHNPSRWPEQPLIEYNVWGDAVNGFFSPEPWVGLQNSLVTGQGLIQLEPGEEFDWTIHLEFERADLGSGAAP